jgi:hypothetical protein
MGGGIRKRDANERIRRTGPCRCLVPFDLHRPERAKGPGCLPRVTLGPPGTGCLHLVSEVPPRRSCGSRVPRGVVSSRAEHGGAGQHPAGRGQAETEAGRAPAAGQRRPSDAGARHPGRRPDDAAATGRERARAGTPGHNALTNLVPSGQRMYHPPPPPGSLACREKGPARAEHNLMSRKDYAPSGLPDGGPWRPVCDPPLFLRPPRQVERERNACFTLARPP